jgi:hypothetical protein
MFPKLFAAPARQRLPHNAHPASNDPAMQSISRMRRGDMNR